MANRLGLRMTGLSELRHAVTAYGQAVVSDAQGAVTDAVEATVAQARAAAPVLTGALQRSITGTLKHDGYSLRGIVRAAAPHAHLLEFGTERVRKRPFLIPSAILNRRLLNARLTSSVQRRSPDGLGTPRLTGEGASTPGITVP